MQDQRRGLDPGGKKGAKKGDWLFWGTFRHYIPGVKAVKVLGHGSPSEFVIYPRPLGQELRGGPVPGEEPPGG